jgi:hypothetical protein
LEFVTSTCKDKTSSIQVDVTPTKTTNDTLIEDVGLETDLEKEVFEFEYIPSPDHVIKRVTGHVIKRVIKRVTALVTKPVNGIYEFGAFEVDRFQ